VGGTGFFAIGAVSAVSLVALCVVVGRFYGQKRWQRIIWGFKLPAQVRPKIIIETIEGEETGLYRRPSAGFGAVAAVAQLSIALNASRSGLARRMARSLEHPVALSFSSEQQADSWCSNADTVIVGGPKSNEIAAEVLRAFGCQSSGSDLEEDELLRQTSALRASGGGASKGLGVATQGNSIYWFGEKYAGNVTVATDPTPGTTGYNGYDYGIVLRLPSPTDSARRSVVVFGSQTFGVDAASTWLVNLRSHTAGRKVRATMAKHRNVAVLVKADVRDGGIEDVELREMVVLPDPLSPRHW
jgi:hypothetical protein